MATKIRTHTARPLTATLLALALLTGCTSPKQECENSGGEWVQTGTRIENTTILTGRTPITYPIVTPVHECQHEEPTTNEKGK